MVEETKLAELKDLYDELWSDARTLVKDMNKNIQIVFFYGVMCLCMAIVEAALAIRTYAKFEAGTAEWMDWIYLGGGVAGAVVLLVAGVSILWWYSTLRKRYRKLIEIEKKLGE